MSGPEMAKSLKLLTAVFDILAKKAINTMESMVRPVPKLSDLLRRGLGMPFPAAFFCASGFQGPN
jgi:hypothetical protein